MKNGLLKFLNGLKDKENNEQFKGLEKTDKLVKKEIVASPLKGEVIPLAEVKDEAFSTGVLGKGVAVEPTEGKVISPINGTVISVVDTGHAIGITSDTGAEIIIHIGMDTVELKGKYFNTKVNQGDIIKIGEILIEFDIEAIKKEGYVLTTPIVVTNSDSYLDIIATDKKNVDYKDDLITIMS
jgi:PTS system beta-glucosides-specific IIC component